MPDLYLPLAAEEGAFVGFNVIFLGSGSTVIEGVRVEGDCVADVGGSDTNLSVGSKLGYDEGWSRQRRGKVWATAPSVASLKSGKAFN